MGNFTVGDWMAFVMSEFPPIEGTSGVTAECSGPTEKLRCEVDIQRAAGNEVWKWGLWFEANGVTGDMARETIKCNAAG